MPKIAEFDPGQLALRPSEVGVEATAGAARRIGAFFNQAAEAKSRTGQMLGSGVAAAGEAAVATEDHREISTGAAHGVQVLSNLEQSKDAAIAEIDPNDPAYGPKVEARLKQWNEQQVEPALEQFSQGFNTQKSQAWAEAFIDKTRTSLFHSSVSDVASANRTGFLNSTRATINTATNLVTQKPELLDDQLDLLRHSLAGSGSALKGVAGAALMSDTIERASEQAVKGAAVGAIAKSSDPEATAAEFVRRYPQYINGQEAVTLAANARSQIRARDADAQRNEARAKAEARDVSSEVGEAYRVNIDSKDPRIKNDQAAQQVLNDPRLLPKDRANLIDYIKRQAKPETEVRISRETTVGLLREMRDPDADPDKLMQRAWDARLMDPGSKGSMTEADFNSFRKEMVDRKTPDGMALSQDRTEFFKKYDASIDGAMAMGEHSALGKQRMYQAQQDAARMEADLKRQGKDPHQIYNPASPNFFGKPENLSKYAVSFQDAQKYDRDIGKATAPAAPGASPAKGISATPAVGDVMRGFRFKGGDPSDRGNWEKAK